jgi:hypothetical protein
VQGAGLAVHTYPAVVVYAIGGIGVLLNFSNQDAGTDGMEREFQMTVGGVGPVTPNAPKTQIYTVNLIHKRFGFSKTIFVDWMQVFMNSANLVPYLVDYGAGINQSSTNEGDDNNNTYLDCSVDNDGLVKFYLDGNTDNWEFQSICGYY